MQLNPHAELVIEFGGGPLHVHFQIGVDTGTPTGDIELHRVEQFGTDILGSLAADQMKQIADQIREEYLP